LKGDPDKVYWQLQLTSAGPNLHESSALGRRASVPKIQLLPTAAIGLVMVTEAAAIDVVFAVAVAVVVIVIRACTRHHHLHDPHHSSQYYYYLTVHEEAILNALVVIKVPIYLLVRVHISIRYKIHIMMRH
jgi:hypothetical protein